MNNSIQILFLLFALCDIVLSTIESNLFNTYDPKTDQIMSDRYVHYEYLKQIPVKGRDIVLMVKKNKKNYNILLCVNHFNSIFI